MTDHDTGREGVPGTPGGRTGQDLDVQLLEAPPAIAGQFARAVATGMRRPGATGTLPQRRLMLTGVEQDVARLADYCEVTGSVLSDRLPVTWLHVLTFPLQVALMAGRDFPFPMLGMVHVANAMTQHRPVLVTESLTLSSWAENLAPHRRGHTVDLVGEATVGDEVVWQGRSTYLVRGKGGSGGEGSEQAVPEQAQPQRIPTQIAQWRLPADLGRRYAAVAGDANPIHLSALSAKALGFPRAIAHGMWTHARMLAAVQPRLPEAFTVAVDFRKPILLPSTVLLSGVVGDGHELSVTSRDGTRTHLRATITAPGSA